MPSESPLLTIAIPTYNRSRYLSRLLDSLLSQLKAETFDKPRVELLISDNASSDDTSAILETYRLQGLRFRSLRNQTNLGGDANIAQCFAEASGQYVWIIGDDDIVLPGALAFLLDFLAQDEYDLVHLRSKPLIEESPTGTLLRSPRTEIIRDARTFTLRAHVYLTFITGNIVNKRRVLSLPHPPFSELIGTSLVQLGWMYTSLHSFRIGAFIHDPLVAASADDRGGYSLITVFGTNLKYITETWLKKPALVRIVLNGTLQTFFPFFVLRAHLREGAFFPEDQDALLHSLFSDRRRYYFFIYPLLKLPPQLGRLWLLLCRVINRFDKALGNPMLR
jgi:abequosyltransferase